MGTVSSSLNPGITDLLNTLTSVNSPIMNSPSVVSALEKAPASDIVQLSEEATQLQGVDALFGLNSTPAQTSMQTLFGLPATSTSSTNTVLQALENAGGTVSPADQAANDQLAAQSTLTQGLFGTGTSTNLTGLLFNTVG
jgi:hypothetical protein